MKLLTIPLAIIGLVVAIAIAGPLHDRWQDANDYKRQADAIALERQYTQLQDYQAQTQATAMSRALASNAGYLGVVLVGLLGIVYAVDRAARRREPLIRFGGEYVPRRLIESGQLIDVLERRIMADAVARIEAARNVGTPHVFSPHYSSRSTDLALPEMPPQLSVSTVPSFGDLLSSGRLGKGNPLVLGYDEADNTEVNGSWLDLYSTAIGGMPGTGKTTTQRFLACQTALQGARFAIIDPHAGAASDSLAGTLAPLSRAFVCEPASSDKAILETVRYVADVGRRRIEGKDSDTTPLILWADELTALLGRSSIADELGELLERVAQEYRKRFVFVCGSGQIWTASRTTSELRDSFASVVCHRMKRAQARLLLPTDEAEQVERLATGHAVLWRTSGVTQVISVPNCTAQDVERVGLMVTSGVSPLEPRGSLVDAYGNSERKSNGSLMDSTAPTESSAPARATTPSATDARILSLFLDGNDAAEIVRQLWPDTKPGRATQERSAYVQAAIRGAMRG